MPRRFKTGRYRASYEAPEVPIVEAPEVPTVTSRRDEALREADTDPRTTMGPRAPQRQRLSAEQFSDLYPEFSVSFIEELNKKGVGFYLNPFMGKPGSYGWNREINLKYTGGDMPALGTAAHEVEHAGQHLVPGLFAFDKLNPEQQRQMVASGPLYFPQQAIFGQDIAEQFAYGLSQQQDFIDPAFYGPMFEGGITPISEIWGNKTWETRQRIKSNRGVR